MFKLTRKELIEIFVSEGISYSAGVPVVGTVGALTMRALRELVENTAEIRLPQRINEPSDEFLNQHPLALAGLYDREKLLRGRLLYVEQVSFVDRLVAGLDVQIDIEPQPGALKLQPFAHPDTERLRDKGLQRLREVGKYRRDTDTIRVSRIDLTESGARLTVQKAKYRDQVRSNLILDFLGDEKAQTIRQALLAESPGRLPQLDDPRLANTLGVTVLVFYRDDRGVLTPFLVPRTKHTAVMNRGLWSDSASGAAEWPIDEQSTPKTFQAYILDDLYQELKSEIGLNPDDLSLVLPLAICREVMRAGKPQMFFIGFTHLDRRTLLRRMESARSLAKRNPIEPEEIYSMPLARQPPKAISLPDLHKDRGEMGVDPQCLASLHYSLTFLEALGSRLPEIA
jgi:hypothetical protein